MNTASTAQSIRDVLARHGNLPVAVDTIAGGDDLYDKGLTSAASVSVMLALEDTFDIEFPDEMLQRRTFASIENIECAVSKLVTELAAS